MFATGCHISPRAAVQASEKPEACCFGGCRGGVQLQPWLSVADGCCFQNLTGAHSLQRLPGLNANWREMVLKRL